MTSRSVNGSEAQIASRSVIGSEAQIASRSVMAFKASIPSRLRARSPILHRSQSLKNFARSVVSIFGSDTGSASVEFVVLAIPLFLPILLYVTQFSEVSRAEIEGRSLIREVVRAYVSSDTSDHAEANAKFVLDIGAERLRFTQGEIDSMNLTFSCSSHPCITAGERVRGELVFKLGTTRRTVRVAAQEYVSPWQ